MSFLRWWGNPACITRANALLPCAMRSYGARNPSAGLSYLAEQLHRAHVPRAVIGTIACRRHRHPVYGAITVKLL